MKLWAALVGFLGVAAGFGGGRSERLTIVVSGDLDGYLSPCGCSYPMVGGIKRRGSVARPAKDLLWLDNGAFVKDVGRQAEMKADAVAQSLDAGGVAAVNYTPEDARLGPGARLSVSNLLKDRLLNSQLADLEGVLPWRVQGPFLIGAATTRVEALEQAVGKPAKRLNQAVNELVATAAVEGKLPILLLNGTLAEARKLASELPALRLIVYRSSGDPPAEPLREGDTWLVTPGDRGRNLIRLVWNGHGFEGYGVVQLGPEHREDEEVSRIYAMYLRRVDGANLLARVPRTKGEAFAGNELCGSCHGKALEVWRHSAHSHALETLEKEGHARDPDCVACHVVGLTVDTGFRSRTETPQLADVGCESCHGAGKAHADQPKLVQMPRVGSDACVPCHTPENSPRFDFKAYWERIKH